MMDRVPAILLTAISLGLPGCTGKQADEKQEAKAPAIQPDSIRAYALMTPAEREAIRAELRNKGLYDCCVEPGCMECVSDPGECSCQQKIRSKDPICGECLDGYREGRGKLKLVSVVELERIRRSKAEKSAD